MKIECRDDSLTVTAFDAIEAFKIACKIEKDGIEFYRNLAVQEPDPSAKIIFEYLANEEKKHLAFFERQLVQARKTGTEEFEDDDIFSCIEYGIFELYKSIDDLPALLADIKKALKLGIQVEKRSVQFYGVCKDSITDTAVKEALQTIIDEEKSHARKISDLLTSVEKNKE